MNFVSKDIITLLELSFENIFEEGVNLFINYYPDFPDFVVSIFDTEGKAPEVLLDGTKGIEFQNFQIRIRDKNNVYCEAIAFDIYQYLHGMNNFETENYYYYYIQANHSPAFLEKDEKGRSIYVLNFNCIRKNK